MTIHNKYKAFKEYLQGEKSTYPSSLTTEAINRLLKGFDASYNSIFECTDITLLTQILNVLTSKVKSIDALEALKYGNNACRPALREYINFLSGKHYSVKTSPLFNKQPSKTPRSIVSVINGLDVLSKLTEADGGLKEHMLKNTYFFHPDIVKLDCLKMRIKELINGNELLDHELPVRYSTKMEYYDNKGNLLLKSNGGKKEALKLNNIYKYAVPYHSVQKRGCIVKIDPDGNAAIRDKTHEYTGHWVSSGKAINTISYYMISHIWGETYDPLFFSSLWNVAITPLYCAPILDKDDLSGDVIKDIKDTYKAICYLLFIKDHFSTNEIKELFRSVEVDNPLELSQEVLEYANNCIIGKMGFNIQFLTKL